MIILLPYPIQPQHKIVPTPEQNNYCLNNYCLFGGRGVGRKSKISVSGKGSLKPGRKLFTGSIQVHEIYNNAAKKAAEQF